MITFDVAKPADAFDITLREEDLQEAGLYLGRGSPAESLWSSLQACPDSITARDDEGRIVAIGGLQYAGDAVHPWLMCSALVDQHRKFALRFSRAWLRNLMGQLPKGTLLCNYIGKDSRSNRRFVRALGFRIVPCPAGPFDFFYLPHPHV